MEKKGYVTGTIQTEKKEVSIDLPIIQFEEDGSNIVYCPAIDVYGYGLTAAEAEKSFSTVLFEFLKYTINKGTLYTDLKRLGWTISKNKNNKITPPPMTQLLSENVFVQMVVMKFGPDTTWLVRLFFKRMLILFPNL